MDHVNQLQCLWTTAEVENLMWIVVYTSAQSLWFHLSLPGQGCFAPSWVSASLGWEMRWPQKEHPVRCLVPHTQRKPGPPGAWSQTWRWIETSNRNAHTIKVTFILMSSYLLSFWGRLSFWIFFTVASKTLLASLAKSRSLTSDSGTDTMAKASLSSFERQVPIWQDDPRKTQVKNLLIFRLSKFCVQTLSITGRSSSASMGKLVLVTQVLVHRCRSLT